MQSKALKIFYFYIDTTGTMYFIPNMAQLNFFIRNSSNERDVFFHKVFLTSQLISKLKSSAMVSQFQIQNCRVSGIKTFPALDYVPFYHRQCFELHLSHGDQMKQLFIFSIIEEDIESLQEYVKSGWQRLKSQLHAEYNDKVEQEWQEKVDLINKITQLLDQKKDQKIQILSNDQKIEPQEVIQNEITYTGQVKDDLPDGTGTLFFTKEGISFVGEFKQGSKHGSGYIVDSNLDMIYCEFINDQLSGI